MIYSQLPDARRFLKEIEDPDLRGLLKDVVEYNLGFYKKQFEISEIDLQILNQ